MTEYAARIIYINFEFCTVVTGCNIFWFAYPLHWSLKDNNPVPTSSMFSVFSSTSQVSTTFSLSTV